MKKIISTILFGALSFLAAVASPISQSAAEKIARDFFSAGAVNPAMQEELTRTGASAPSYYVFNNPAGGWVIIAGDDCCEPVLAYSASGSFSTAGIPSNFTAWMSKISSNVDAVRKAGVSPGKAIRARWAAPGSVKKAAASQKLIETAAWGQGAPYYNSCPKYKQEPCATGCVATAMAIVLRHNQYPTSGTGTIPAYTTYTNEISVPAVTLGSSYDWANMPLSYTSSATTAQKNAVARLMFHCGAMVEMDYDPDGSGAYSSDIIPALAKYMGYSKAARELYRYNYSNTDWFNIIKAEIDADRVMIYGGADADTEDGHQFVLDGYNSDNMVHINWGWDGSCNAWYAINYLGDKNDKGVDDVFSYSDSAIIGLAPEAGPSTQSVELCLEGSDDNSLKGLTLTSGGIAKGSSFQVTVGFICNYDYYNDYSGAVKLGLYDRSGTLKEYVSAEKSVSIDKATASGYYLTPGYTDLTLDCAITKDIALGDFLMAVYKLSDDSWAILGGYSSDEFTDSKSEYHTLYKLGAMDLAMLNVPDTVTAGQVLYFDLVGCHRLPSTIKWYWDNAANTKRFVEATAGSHTMKAVVTYTDGTVETVQKEIQVQ